MKRPEGRELRSNIFFSMGAQAVHLLVSLILSMIVPKFIDEYQYAYWQMYVLYVSYVGIFHFGLLDGIMLRYARFDYDELDKKTMRSQFVLILCLTGAAAAVTGILAAIFAPGVYRTVFLLVAAGAVTKNIYTYASYTFQITNRIRFYAGVTLANRAVCGALVVLFLLLGLNDFLWYAMADLAADLLSVLFFLRPNREVYLGSLRSPEEALAEGKTNISAGWLLLIANFSSMLMIGGAKMVTQWHWDDLTFGKVSFAFSVSNLFLVFVSAISVVLFPAIKRTPEAELPRVYRRLRRLISLVLTAVLIFYFPGCFILELWLPNYAPSLRYLGLLLPLVLYSSKVSLLTDNYLKAYMQQKKMFLINLVTLGLAMLLFLSGAFLFDSLETVLIGVVVCIGIRAVWSEAEVMKLLGQSGLAGWLWEAGLTAAFILCAMRLPLWTGCAVYAACLLAYGAFDLWTARREKKDPGGAA